MSLRRPGSLWCSLGWALIALCSASAGFWEGLCLGQAPACQPPLPPALSPRVDSSLPTTPPRPLEQVVQGGRLGSAVAPGQPPRGGRPLPGGVLDPGAAGPGVGRAADEDFLGGA